MTITNELLDELLKGCERPEDLLGDAGLMKELKIRLMERMLGAELTAHLGYEASSEPPPGQVNRRNGSGGKRLKGQDGELPISVPRDRDGSFEPELVRKGQTRLDGIDDKIIGLYAHGLSVRDIRAHLEELYGLKVSPDLISREAVIPFFAFAPAIRKIIYTTNAIESLNRVIRKTIKTRGSFPTEEAATKLIYLAIRNFEKGGRNVREWFAARNQLAIMFDTRFNA